jgi:pimeloyl-ACP methyl ester carboxylesterase/Mg-chelatase subunit ChlD
MKRMLSVFIALCVIATLIQMPAAQADIVDYKVVKPLPVLFVHGYDDDGKSWRQSGIYNYVQTLGAKVVSVDYGSYSKNDITSTTINDIYSDAIDELPEGQFDIVAHSMGGLLTRYYLLKNPDVRERVRRVIMIGTPNHGSPVSFLNRIQDMIDDPQDYWEDGKRNKDVVKYRELYKEYINDMFDSYEGGPMPKQPYEYWLSKHKDKPLDKIKSLEFQEAGAGLDDLGTEVLAGGLGYRYSKAFDEYAKLSAARSYERDDRAAMYAEAGIYTPAIQDEVDGQHLAQRGGLDEGTIVKEYGGSWYCFVWCGQNNTSKNIVQDRLMMERFDLGYTKSGKSTKDNGKFETEETVVANLFLHRLWLDESRYRRSADRKNEYYPQFITIGTEGDPDEGLGRGLVDKYIKNQSAWKYENHDAVVPLSSVTLVNWRDKDANFVDRNVKYVPSGSIPTKIKDNVTWNESGYISHMVQMDQLELLKREYENPLTGDNDADTVMTLDPTESQTKTGRIIVIKPNNESLGNEYTLRISAPNHVKVRIAERNESQTWDVLKPVDVMVGDYQGYQGEFKFKAKEEVYDYLIVASDDITITYEPETDENGEVIGTYPYYLQPLENDIGERKTKQTFRVIDRVNNKAVSGLDAKDFVFRLNGQVLRNPNVYMNKKTIKSVSSIMLALDFSGSMDGNPRLLSMHTAGNFIWGLIGKTKALVGVLGFTETVHVLSGLTDNHYAASKTVASDITGGTALYDAVVAGSNMLADEKGKKSMILLTDGADADSGHTLEEAIAAANDASVGLYIFGFGDVELSVLQTLADETGGKLFYTEDPGELSELYETVSKEQDYIYTLEFDTPDLTQSNELSLVMTDERSNTAEVTYDPQLKAKVKDWWSRGEKFIEDMREAY